ncbi:PREDICTED: galanin receptor type 2 [Myotis brandtii]|uniref:galanin receptor type 2 n=1 Tax=Myotis brandtii TaxID=109478 RepID=UPI0007047A8E|nr:PREDICTED: galanin receptor type 2 [Myotis brandtii]
MHASSFTLAAVSLDRYLAIRYPLRSRELRTPRNALGAIGLIWGLSLLFSGPYLSYYRQSRLANLTVCHPAWSAPRRRAMDLCTFVFSYLLPLLVLGSAVRSLGLHSGTLADWVRVGALRTAELKTDVEIPECARLGSTHQAKALCSRPP